LDFSYAQERKAYDLRVMEELTKERGKAEKDLLINECPTSPEAGRHLSP
jgi:hypothetical protein